MPDLLTIERLSAGYGEAVVLDEISLALAEGQSLALLGRNGMGKTTLINSIVGVTRFIGGTIALDGRELRAPRVVVTTGTFLQGLMHQGESKTGGGRMGDAPAAGLSESLRALGLPLYVSLSRKDFIGAVLAGSWDGRLPAGEREWGTVAAVTLAVREGADVLRIHDHSSLQAMRVAGRIAREAEADGTISRHIGAKRSRRPGVAG